MGALQPGGGALQLEWEEPLSAQHKTIRRSLHSEHSVRRHKTQNITEESALIEVKAFTLLELPLCIVPLCSCALYPYPLVQCTLVLLCPTYTLDLGPGRREQIETPCPISNTLLL